MAPPPEKEGFTGLYNLGNTCFMNAVLQVLANTTRVRDFFMVTDFQNHINEHNKLGSQGRLAIQFAVVLRQLWSGKPSFQPSKLKELVSQLNVLFRGYAQHDAHEFLEFLLDGLHEDLNRGKGKALPLPSLDDLTDKEAASILWEYYKTRNDSFIVDQFQGQLRSELVCPDCEKVSVTFDPYRVISVPIPVPTCKIPLIFFPKHTENSRKPPVKMCIEVPTKRSQHDIAEEVATRTGIKSIAHLEFVEVREHTLEPLTTHSHYKPSAGKTLYAFEVDTAVSAAEPVTILYCSQRLLQPPELARCAYCQAEKSEGATIRKCTGCRKVGYCSADCQKSHWDKHKGPCKDRVLEPIGQPFVVSLPTSRLFYQNLYDIMLSYAQLSVTIKTTDCSSSVNGRSEVDSCANEQLFFIKPVKENGTVIVGDKGSRLKANDTEPLSLSSKYFTLDWKNDAKVSVRSKSLEVVETAAQNGDVDLEKGTGLDDCLNLFTKRETLSKQDSWYCPKCKDHKEADKQVSLWTLPDTLIIQLKRFSFHNAYYRHKREEFVTYPIEGLEMSKYCRQNTGTSQLYDLYGVINHHGVLGGGHYTAYARCLNKYDSSEEMGWRLMDDGLVTSVADARAVVSKSAYVLFYQRRAPPRSTKLSDIITLREEAPLPEIDDRMSYFSEEEGEPLSMSSFQTAREYNSINPYATSQSSFTNASGEDFYEARDSFDNETQTDHGYASAPTGDVGNDSATTNEPFDKIKDNILSNGHGPGPNIYIDTQSKPSTSNNFYNSGVSPSGEYDNDQYDDSSEPYTNMYKLD